MDPEKPASPDYAGAVSLSPGGALVDVWVVPGASKTEITGLQGSALRIRVSAPPDGGQANRALNKVLTAITGAPVELIRGSESRRKCFLIKGLDPVEVVRLLSKHSG